MTRTNRGFIFPLVVGVVVILSIFFLTMSNLTQGQMKGTSFYLLSTRTLDIAEWGSRWGMMLVEKQAEEDPFEPSDFLQEGDVPFFRSILENKVGKTRWEIAFKDPLSDFDQGYPEFSKFFSDVSEAFSGDAGLEVSLQVTDLQAIPGGFPKEREGKIRIVSKAHIGNHFRTVTLTKGVRFFLMVHPILSKFTFFVKQSPGDRHLNVLRKRTAEKGYLDGMPLTLENQGATLGAENGGEFPVIKSGVLDFSVLPQSFPDIARKSGWIYMGGPNWTLNLCGSESGTSGPDAFRFDDRVFLRFAFYGHNDVSQTDQASTTRITSLVSEFDGYKEDYLTLKGTKVEPAPPNQCFKIRGLLSTPSPSSILRPFGDGHRLSPTLIFGSVWRKYLLMKRILWDLMGTPKKLGDFPLFRDEAAFLRTFNHPHGWPDSPPNPLRSYAQDIYLYKTMMGVTGNPGDFHLKWRKIGGGEVVEPYLSSLDFLFATGTKEIGALPKVSPGQGFAIPFPPQCSGTDQIDFLRLTPRSSSYDILQASGVELIPPGETSPFFSGDLGGIAGIPELKRKIIREYETPVQFLKMTLNPQTRKIIVPGIAFVRKGDLSLPGIEDVARGGIIIVNGNIRISGPIKATGDPLTLVAKGNITMEAGATLVQAHLICLNGVFSAEGQIKMTGGLAAKEVVISQRSKEAEKVISFEPRHDPFNNTGIDLYGFGLSASETIKIESGE